MTRIVSTLIVALVVAVLLVVWPGHLLAVTSGAWRWLLTPISGTTEHDISLGTAWHGRLMVLAWIVLMPIAFLIARFYKITPGQDWPRVLDNPFWFVNHRRLGYWIALITTAGLVFILWDRGGFLPWQNYHAAAGWILFALGWFQVINALLRGTHGGPIDSFTRQSRPAELWPGDHFSLTTRRIVFEYVHKIVGYLIVLLVAAAIASGLKAADAPRWMWIAIGVWSLACVVVFIRLQRTGRCIDTYQAIWGLDESLPGYRRNPIGWGITRVSRAPRSDEGS